MNDNRTPLFEVKRNVWSAQAANCLLCIHIGSVAVFFGRRLGGYGTRIEICTPARWFRFSRGKSAQAVAKRFA